MIPLLCCDRKLKWGHIIQKVKYIKTMGVYSEYLNKNLSFEELIRERKAQLKKISEIRNRDVLVFASDLNKRIPDISIGYSDLLPIKDQLDTLQGGKLDLIIETPGGSGEVAEDIVKLLRNKYDDIAVIVPGWAKSAGTIIAMSGNEILMEPGSALGPIDAQLTWQGKTFSAQALLDGLDKLKEEVEKTSVLNKAYIPILQGMSLGEVENARNSLSFAKILVTEWLREYKFKDWNKHKSNGNIVTQEEKDARANEIAEKLCDHKLWKTHGRSLKIKDLEDMKIKITDYSKETELYDAINRYSTLLQMTFATNIYKIIETVDAQIYRFANVGGLEKNLNNNKNIDNIIVDFECQNCKHKAKIQANLKAGIALKNGHTAFPKSNKYFCSKCHKPSDLSDIRRDIEAKTKKSIYF